MDRRRHRTFFLRVAPVLPSYSHGRQRLPIISALKKQCQRAGDSPAGRSAWRIVQAALASRVASRPDPPDERLDTKTYQSAPEVRASRPGILLYEFARNATVKTARQTGPGQ